MELATVFVVPLVRFVQTYKRFWTPHWCFCHGFFTQKRLVFSRENLPMLVDTKLFKRYLHLRKRDHELRFTSHEFGRPRKNWGMNKASPQMKLKICLPHCSSLGIANGLCSWKWFIVVTAGWYWLPCCRQAVKYKYNVMVHGDLLSGV